MNPYGYYAPPVGYYAAPPVVYAPSASYTYVSPNVTYGGAVYQDPAPSTSTQSIEVVHPSGKYVLEGDGVRQPYQWVWIPASPAQGEGAAGAEAGSDDN